MLCIYCGSSNPDDAAFCSACGKPTAVVAESNAHVEKPASQATVESQSPAPAPTPSPAAPSAASAQSHSGLLLLALFLGAALAVLLVVVIQDRREASAREAGLRDALEASARAPDAQPRVNDPSPATPAPQPSPDVQVAPPPPPAAPPPAPAPSNSIVGKWKLTQVLGSTYLTFMADGHYSIENLLGMTETGLYVFSPDGTLRMQDDSFFSGQTTIWHCSVSGDSLSVLEGDSGAAHLYTRIGG